MERLIGWTKADAWGSTNAIPEFLGDAAGDEPVSEVWFGAHPDGPTLLTGGQTLAEHIGRDPKGALGGGLLRGSRFEPLVQNVRPLSPALTGQDEEDLLARLEVAQHRRLVHPDGVGDVGQRDDPHPARRASWAAESRIARRLCRLASGPRARWNCGAGMTAMVSCSSSEAAPVGPSHTSSGSSTG